MKIVQVNCVYGTGSTGKIVSDLHKGLSDRGVVSVVCYGRGKLTEEENVYKTCGETYSRFNQLYARTRGQMYGGCRRSTDRLLSIIEKEKPDIVHLHCINGFFVNIPRLIAWLKQKGIKTVLTLHAEFMYTANCGYAITCERWKSGCGRCPRLRTDLKIFGLDGTHASWKKMARAFQGFSDDLMVVSVSPWLMGRAMQSPFLADKKHRVVFNGLDRKVFFPRKADALREKYRQAEKIALFVTTCLTDDKNDIKGGHYIIKLAEILKNENIIIIVAGKYDRTLALPENMIMLDRLEDQDVLAQYYSIADVTVLTSMRETFSMVTAESLCCGTPVVGFEAGGPESIALSEYSEFVPQGDLAALETTLFKMLDKKIDRQKLAEKAGKRYSGESMALEYLRLYGELMRKGHGNAFPE